MRTAVFPERVFTATNAGPVSHATKGRLVNTVGSIKWECSHRHHSSAVAMRCADAERRRWIRSGQAPV